MRMQRVYEFDVEHRSDWLSKTLAPCALILVLLVVVCTVLALDASMTPEQRIAIFQQSGVFPRPCADKPTGTGQVFARYVTSPLPSDFDGRQALVMSVFL